MYMYGLMLHACEKWTGGIIRQRGIQKPLSLVSLPPRGLKTLNDCLQMLPLDSETTEILIQDPDLNC